VHSFASAVRNTLDLSIYRGLKMTQAVATRPVQEVLHWPGQGFTHVPMQVFIDPEIYS